MAKQFTREWEIWKLTNEAAAGREDEEKIEREKKMAGARKERDRVRAEMIREEAAERALRGDVELGGVASDNRGGGRGGGERSPPWGGRGGSGSPGRAPWDEPARSDVGDSAPWDRPIGGGESDGGVSPAWDGGISAGSTSISGRAPWDEPAESSSAPWNDTSRGPGGRSPSYDPPDSTGGQSYGSSSRAPWDAPAGGRSPTYEPLGPGRNQSYQSGQQASSPSRAPWDAPTGGRSPTYESPGSGRSQSYQSGQQASPSLKTPLGQPAEESSVAPWDQPAVSPSRAPWDDGTGDNDSSVFRSPSSSPERTPTSPPATTWDAPTGGPESDGILTTSNDTVGERRGRVAAHELHTFSALSAMGAPWGQDSDVNESEYRDPNSEGEQAYLGRAAVAGSGAEARDARNEGGSNEGGNAPCDNNDNGDSAGGGNVSPPWSGGFGGSSPAAGDSSNDAPWENY